MLEPAHPSRGYAVRNQTLTFGGHDLLLQSLLDDQQFHDPEREAERLGICAASWPLFGVLWPSACVLAERMSTIDFDRRRVLEAGCGLGLASLVAHRRGADVTASDIHPLSARFLARNAARNQLSAIPFHRGGWADADALGEFALIVASDVLYQRHHVDLLAAYVLRHAAPRSELLLVDPGRGHHNHFARAMLGHGFAHSFEQPLPHETAAGRFAGKVHSFVRTR